MTEKLFPKPAVSIHEIRTRRTQAERTALSDARMFEAAMTIIADRGTHELTLKEVGEAAGYSRGLASGRFGSKNNLFNELIVTASARWAALVRDRLGDARGLRALSIYVNFCSDLLVSDFHEFKSLYQLCYEAIGGNTTAKVSVGATHELVRDQVAAWIGEAIADGELDIAANPRTLALCYASLLYGLVFQILANPHCTGAREGLEHINRSFWLLLGTEEPH